MNYSEMFQKGYKTLPFFEKIFSKKKNVLHLLLERSAKTLNNLHIGMFFFVIVSDFWIEIDFIVSTDITFHGWDQNI